MAKIQVGSTLSSDILIQLSEATEYLQINVVNLTSGLATDVLEKYLYQSFEEELKGNYEVVYKGAPKWVIKARIAAMAELIGGKNG